MLDTSKTGDETKVKLDTLLEKYGIAHKQVTKGDRKLIEFTDIPSEKAFAIFSEASKQRVAALETSKAAGRVPQ